MYTIHIETIGETIKSNFQNNIKPGTPSLDWHVVGIFETLEEAMKFGLELAAKFGVVLTEEQDVEY